MTKDFHHGLLGITQPWRLTLTDGMMTHDAAFQSIEVMVDPTHQGREPDLLDSYRHNIAAYQLAELIELSHMVPVTVARTWNGTPGALSWWVDDIMFDEQTRLAERRWPDDLEVWGTQIDQMSLFASLVHDTDRHGANVLYASDWKLFMIDFTRAFSLKDELLRPYKLLRVDRRVLDRLARLTTSEVRNATRPHLTENQVEALMDEGVFTIDVVRDVTEPKAVLRSLAESEERLRVAARIAVDLISESDVETGEVTWYGDVDSALGYEPGEFPRTIEGWLSHLHPGDRVRVAQLMDRDVFGARKALALDCRVRTKGGGYRRWRVQGVPLDSGETTARKFVGVSVDVTDQLQLESENQLHREALAHVDRVGLLGEMHVALAHELNQPLTAILSNAQAGVRQLERSPVNTDELRDILSDIISNDRRAGDVIKHLRTMVKTGTTERKLVDINSLIAGALGLVRNSLTMRSIDLETECEPRLPRATVDSIQIEQVLMNLIMNAIDALHEPKPGQRSITVSSQYDESHITVSVRDTGHGIAEASLPNLFETFYTSKPEGLGVGLAISRRLVESHGGRLWLAATSGAGTRMSFTLPIGESRVP